MHEPLPHEFKDKFKDRESEEDHMWMLGGWMYWKHCRGLSTCREWNRYGHKQARSISWEWVKQECKVVEGGNEKSLGKVQKGSRVLINMCIRGNERPHKHGCEQMGTRRPLCTLVAITSLTLSLLSILPFFSAPTFSPASSILCSISVSTAGAHPHRGAYCAVLPLSAYVTPSTLLPLSFSRLEMLSYSFLWSLYKKAFGADQ